MLEVSIPRLPANKTTTPHMKTRVKSELIRNNSSIIPDGKFSPSDASVSIGVELPKDVKNALQAYCQIHTLKTNIDFFLQKSDEEFGSVIYGIHGAHSTTYIHQEDQVVEWINNLDSFEMNCAPQQPSSNESLLSKYVNDLINVENKILNTVEEVEELICSQLKQHPFYQQYPNDFKKYLKLYTQNVCLMDQDPQSWTPMQTTKFSFVALKELFMRFGKRRQRIEKITLLIKTMIADLPKSDKNANDLLSNAKSSAQSIYFDQNLPSAADLCMILKLDIRKTYHQDQRLLDFRFQLKQFHTILMKQMKRSVRKCDQFKSLGQV